MASFTIRIPKSLESAFEAYKDQFNVSEICQEAIKVEVGYQMMLSELQTDRDTIIARLKKEKNELHSHDFQLGRAASFGEIKYVSYAEIKTISDCVKRGCNVAEFDAALMAVDGDSQNCVSDNSRVLFVISNIFSANYDNGHISWDAFALGWMTGLAEQWKVIEAEVEGDEPEGADVPF